MKRRNKVRMDDLSDFYNGGFLFENQFIIYIIPSKKLNSCLDEEI